jgi:phage terminase small subunit
MVVRYRGMPKAKQRDLVKIEKPDCLEGYASEHWDCTVPKFLEMGVLRPVDIEALTALCHWWPEYRTLQESPAGDSSAAYKRSIALASCFKNWGGLAAKFGLTPKDQEKLAIEKPNTDDPAAEFLA